jgi:hypothetical protein
MLVVNLHSSFEDLQEYQDEMVFKGILGNQEKMAQREVLEETAETEEMVHRVPKVTLF